MEKTKRLARLMVCTETYEEMAYEYADTAYMKTLAPEMQKVYLYTIYHSMATVHQQYAKELLHDISFHFNKLQSGESDG